MDDVKRKIYLDLFASPAALLPLVGGFTCWLASWALGGNHLLTFAGVVGVLAGVGIFATRLIFGLEKIAESAYQYALERQRAAQQQELERLYQQLATDNDPRTEELLQALQRICTRLESDLRAGRITSAAQGVLQSVEQMFQLCVDHLRRSVELWHDARQADGQQRNRLMRQREELVNEVKQSVDFLDASLEQLRSKNSRRGRSQLARIRNDLDESIRIARQTEERLESIGPQQSESET